MGGSGWSDDDEPSEANPLNNSLTKTLYPIFPRTTATATTSHSDNDDDDDDDDDNDDDDDDDDDDDTTMHITYTSSSSTHNPLMPSPHLCRHRTHNLVYRRLTDNLTIGH